MDETEARTLLKELQGKLGCGGTLKDSHLEFRGDLREKDRKTTRRQGPQGSASRRRKITI